MNQDWDIKPRSPVCQKCQTPFVDQQPYYTRLSFGKEGYERLDCCEPCWPQLETSPQCSSWKGVFKAPPWTAGGTGGGSPANVYGSATPNWADVELKQLNGVIYWSINHTLIFAYTNTTGYISGDIMLGYTDAYDSIGGSGGGVIYANVRVISLARPLVTKFMRNGSNAEITFTANAGDVPAQFTLQSASAVNGTYADTSSTLTSLGGGAFKSVKAISGSQQFYRIRRIE